MTAPIELLERDDELATIERSLAGAVGGDGGLLTIEGEAGAGKTALLDAAGGLGEERGMLVLRARGGEYERDFPFGVVRQLFEPALADEARCAELLSGTAAMAAPVFGVGGAEQGDTDPLAAQHGLYWLTADLAAATPLLLLVDDVQWADLTSLRALAYIARRLESIPACLAVTVRTGELCEHRELLDRLRGEPHGRAISPPPLSARAVAGLAGGAGQRLTERFADACHRATAGNPFLMVELLRALKSEGAHLSDENAERLTEIAAGGVSRSILARLGRLGEHSVEVARAIAVLEPNAEIRRIAALAGLPQEAIAEACEWLIGAHLLFDARPLGFVHPLVRAAVLDDISEPRRAAAHAHAARLLHEDGLEVDAVAAHLLLAESDADAWVVGELRSAAGTALGRGVPDTAVSYLRRALREPPARDVRLAVSRELGEALRAASDPEGIEVLHTVRAASGDPVLRAKIALQLADSLSLRGACEEAARLLEESRAEMSDPGSQLDLLLRGYQLNQILWGLERAPESALLAQGEPLVDDTPGGRLVLHGTALLEATGLGSVERGGELAIRMITDRRKFAADLDLGLPVQVSLSTATLADRGDLAEGLFELGIESSRRRGALGGIAAGHGIRGLCRFADGSLREAQADAELAIPLLSQFGFSGPLATQLGLAVRVLVARGDPAAAEKLLAEHWGRREPIGGMPGSILLCARGELRFSTGRHAEARHDFLAAAERVCWLPYPNPEGHPGQLGLALCEAALGNGEEARRLAGEAVERAREAGGRRGIGISLRVQGAVAGGDEGIEILREATEVLGGTRARLQHAQALIELGAALRRANHRREARGPLREGLDLAHRCDAAPLEERARTELAATGARPRKVVLSGVDSLTPSELRIARMAAEGMTNREIAQQLFVTAKTVETHLRHVYRKLDIVGRSELPPALAHEQGAAAPTLGPP